MLILNITKDIILSITYLPFLLWEKSCNKEKQRDLDKTLIDSSFKTI